MCRVLVAAAAGLDGEAAVLAAARLALLQGITAYQALIHVSHRRLALQLKVHALQYKASATPHCSIKLCVSHLQCLPVCKAMSMHIPLTSPVAKLLSSSTFTP